MASSSDAKSSRAEDKIGKLIFFKKKRVGGTSDGSPYEGLLENKRVAIKRIRKPRGIIQKVELASPTLAHENVADYLAVEEDNLYIYWAMELCAGSLDNLIHGSYKGPSPGDMIQVLHQTVLGLEYLHSKNIIHGNLKPQNILISLSETERILPKVKLADFRIKTHQAGEMTLGCWGPPEAYDQGETGELDCSADVFSLGCIFAYALTKGSHPFGEEDDQYANIISGQIDWASENNLSIPNLKGLIKIMIAREPVKRPTLKTILQHRSFKVLDDLEKSTFLLQNIRISTQSTNTARRSSSRATGQQRTSISRIPRDGEPIGETSSIGVKVYKATINGIFRAVKRIDTKLYATNYAKEIEILTDPKMSNCQYLVRYFSHEADENFCYIEMEHCAGSLFQFIQTKRLSTVFSGNRQKTRTFQKNIIEGIEFLHKKMNMVHRDIKPSNILIFENHNELIPKIADYGISEVVKHDGKGGAISTQYFRGTDGWKAPELRAYASYSKAVDIFAAGCLLFYIETEGCHPFAGHARVMGSEVQRNIDDFAPNIGSLLKIEPTILDLICRALEKDEKKRSTATEILSHPTFFSNEEAMNYIRRVAEQGKQKMETFFEKLDPSFKLVIIKNDWRSVLDGEVFKEAQMGPQRKPIRSFEEEKYGQSLSNLLSLIRNKSAHFEEMSDAAKSLIGGSPNKYFEYWHEKFPHLLVNTWGVVNNLSKPDLLTGLQKETVKQFTGASSLTDGKNRAQFPELSKQRVNSYIGRQETKNKPTVWRRISSIFYTGKTEVPITDRYYIETRAAPDRIPKKSFFHLLTDFPVHHVNIRKQLRASDDLDTAKRDLINRLRHRIDLRVSAHEDDDDFETLHEDGGWSRSIYDTFLTLLNDYDPCGVCEMLNLLLESRFTIPLLNPLTNENYLVLLKEMCVSAVPSEPALVLGEDTRLSRVAVVSCRNSNETQTLSMLQDLFNIDSLHRNDLLNSSPTEKELTIDLGIGYMGKKAQKQSDSSNHHVLVAHVAGKFSNAMKFINDFADVLLIEDAPTNENGKPFSSLIGKEIRRESICNITKIVLWKPTTSGKLSHETEEIGIGKKYNLPLCSLAIQYGEMLSAKLSTILRDQFTNRRLTRKQLSEMNLMDGQQTSPVSYGASYSDVPDMLRSQLEKVTETRRSLKLQHSFREQANYEESKRLHRLHEDALREADKKIDDCMKQRQKISSEAREIPLIKYFLSLLQNKAQCVRVATLRRFEQSLSRSTETQLETQQNKINQYYKQLIGCGAHLSNQNSATAKEIERLYIEAKLDYRESMLHIEHLWRELSHMYVADPQRNEFAGLPRLAAQHMLDGFAMELLDGDASLINLPWIEAILSNLSELIEPMKRRIFVLSVMGIQSSGKSTLLNAMFGIKMRTSVGQCTRGINMQLIPVEGRPEYDYVLILDTEGTRSPEHWGMPGNEKRDNQMATLSILLADATIIVNPGENDAAVKEILPIVLMAYQNSKLAEDSCGRLSSMIFFVYNRINTTEREKLSNIIQNLSNSLMDAFRKVQAMSGHTVDESAGPSIENANRLFRHFVLDASNSADSDVRILGQNKKSFVPPDNVPDSAYGEMLVEFREHIHKRVTEPRGKIDWRSHSPKELSNYLHDIWNCICSADFSLQFINFVERMSFDQLEAEYQKIERKLAKQYHLKFTDLRKSIAKEAIACSLDDKQNLGHDEVGASILYDALRQRLQSAINKVLLDLDSEFVQTISLQGREKWQPSYKHRWFLSKEKQEAFWQRQLQYSYDAIYSYDKKVEELKSSLRRAIAEQFADQDPQVLQSLKPSKEKFEALMNKHVALAEKDYPPTDVKKCIKDFYADNTTVQAHQIEFEDQSYSKVCKNILSIIIRQSKAIENDVIAAISREIKVLLPMASDRSCSELSSCLMQIQDLIGKSLEGVHCYEEGVVSDTIENADQVLSTLGAAEFSQRQLVHTYAQISLISHMEKIQKKWEASNSVSSKLKRKNSYIAMWEYFQVASQGAKKVRLFGHVVKEKFMHLQKTYKTEVVELTLKRIKQTDWMQHIWSAQSRMDFYLADYVKTKQLPQVIKYVRNPDQLLNLALRHAIAEAVVQVLTREKSWDAFKADFKGALNLATRSALDCKKFRARKFMDSLQSCLLRSISSDSFAKLGLNFNLAEYNELDSELPEEFRKECQLKIEQAINEQAGPDNIMEEFIRQVLDLVTEKLRMEAWRSVFLRCQHCCPWCGSMCVRESGHDPVRFKHDTIHQPAGLVGRKSSSVPVILEPRACSDLKPYDVLQVKGYFLYQKSDYFRDWSSVFPLWEKPRTMQRNPFREYIFYHHHRELAKQYGVQPSPMVPEMYNGDLNFIINNLANGWY